MKLTTLSAAAVLGLMQLSFAGSAQATDTNTALGLCAANPACFATPSGNGWVLSARNHVSVNCPADRSGQCEVTTPGVATQDVRKAIGGSVDQSDAPHSGHENQDREDGRA